MRVLVATDGCEAATAAVRFAALLAARSRGELVAITIGDLSSRLYRGGARLARGLESVLGEEQRLLAEKTLDRARREAERVGARVRCKYAGVRELATTAETILRAAERERADLVVVGSRGASELARWVLGSVTHRLVHSAGRPVAVVRAGKRPSRRRSLRVLVATDGSKAARQAVRFAARLVAQIPRARLVILTVSTLAADLALAGKRIVRAFGMLPDLAQADRRASERILGAAAKVARRLGKRVTLRSRQPQRPVPAAEAIVREAELDGADLVILGNSGQSALGDLVLGSVAERVLGLTSRPVALVRARRSR